MKKICILSLLFVLSEFVYGQVDRVIDYQEIVSNFTCSGTLTISNATIKNGKALTIRGQEVIINPGFTAEAGSNIIIEATGNPLRSDTGEEEVQDDLDFTSLEEIEASPAINLIRIYSIAGVLIYSSDSEFDLNTINLDDGVYVVLKNYDNEETEREKIIIKR